MDNIKVKSIDQNSNDKFYTEEKSDDESSELNRIEKIPNGNIEHLNTTHSLELLNNNETHERRSDEPTELSFEKFPENCEEKEKRQQIENALLNSRTLNIYQDFARSDYGLVGDDLRRKVWPILAGVDPDNIEPAPKLSDLKSHPEYNQVILDVNRSIKRFPPGIPYEQRIALQDQLTVLILRVITKYPHLKYYQGYHDVAITFLLVVGEDVAFHVMEILSTNHLVECMQETMEPTQKRLMFLYPIIEHENEALCRYLQKSSVGTLFALPWYLTWFGHSLNSYRSVVRLYDFFLATPFLLPIYVTAAIVLYRVDDIFKEDCDMASLHCFLSQLPDDLPFEYLLKNAEELYKKYPPSKMEKEVEEMMIKERKQRAFEEEQATLRRKALLERRAINSKSKSIVSRYFSQLLLTKRTIFVTTAFSILFGLYAYYYKTQLLSSGFS
ncbi:TBC1 domain family member 20 [Condylostylus longicornis]|uniref:TBC1 domain family member 20 n=1 Tax=Condylostylus longicornis TaxID=2530218 RepID=UPI00244DF803|nr:TBC1 domain family member 20 [Condylostylus longicornis]